MENFYCENDFFKLINFKTQDKNNANIFPSVKVEPTIEALKNQNKELRNDVAVLKRLVYMLNVELELCDTKHEGYSNENKSCELESRDILKQIDIKKIGPLLHAFEQTREEKEELLYKYKRSFDEFSKRCKEIVLENNILRHQLFQTKTEDESTYIEWTKLYEKFVLMEEHNQLLIRQSKLFQNKIHNMEFVYRKALKQCENDKKELTDKLESMKIELLFLKGRLNVASEKKTQPVEQKDHYHQLNLYGAVLSELKNLSVELKLHHKNEVEALKKRIKVLESQKYDFDISLAKITSERDRLQGYISTMEMEARKRSTSFKNLKHE